MKSFVLTRLFVAAGLLLFSASVGCGGGSGTKIDGGGSGDGPGADRPVDTKVDGAAPVKCSDAGARKQSGEACGCATDCESGFCVDGVCCNTSCDETCKACNTQGAMGMCTFVPAGLKPTRSTCSTEAPESCGSDGTCDGKGACRKHPMGTVCAKGMCDGAGTATRKVCDGAGTCQGEDLVCAPYSCDGTSIACFDKCTSNSDCAPGVQCVSGSCGPKMRGATCGAGTECLSGTCVDGVCCDSECKGACVTCNQRGREGTCWPIDLGINDPRNVCKDAGKASCGLTGTCDGFGGCAKYARDTVCVPPSCAGDKLNTAGTCDGLGTCQPPSVQDCPPFRCLAGACKQQCDADTDCVTGIACVNHSCGPKQNGGTCAAAADCKSGFCVDGVCCDQACTGACRSCSLASSKGKCTPLAAAADDSRKVCKDQGATSCGTDGKCDGAGGCRKYAVGTVCVGEKCASNIYTGASTCNATGQCVAPASRPCAPFACNGVQKCFNACTTTANCVSPNVCNGNSCGKKLNGAPCSAGTECASTICAQGVCCGTSCNASCKSCNLPNSMGACTNVATGTLDPKAMCADMGAATCGTNGRCAAGACQRYAAGVKCKDATCPATTTMFTGQSTCDGAGKCNTPATTSCFPFTCGAAACKNTCTANADCSGTNVCINGSCGLRPPGSPCGVGTECSTGVCSAEKVCCDTACNGPCVSCKLPATNGKCSPIAAGNADPTGQCLVSAPATCGNDGKCNGAGACTKYPANTPCAPAMCPAPGSMRTLGKTCNGLGACSVGGGPQPCAPFTCDGAQACRDTCVSNQDCVMPNTCVGNVCGKKPPGAACSSPDQCTTGLCTDGFCCNTASCGACKACGATGACQNDDGTSCMATDMCHVSDGTCSGGACQRGTISCDDNNPCTADSCNPASGCAHAPLTGGTCNDLNACTQTDACLNGVCTGSNPVTCGAPPQCKVAGVCNAGTGQCAYMNAPDGTGCNDQNACTQADKCDDGVCVAGTAVTCTAMDQCHTAGTCNPANGVCSQPAKAPGADCDDGNACTQADACQGGGCVGAPVVCTAIDKCHLAGACNPANGTCSQPVKPLNCTASDQCHLAGTCNLTDGECTNPPKGDGESCTDNNFCTVVDQCMGGTCTPGPAFQCLIDGTVCEPSLGICL